MRPAEMPAELAAPVDRLIPGCTFYKTGPELILHHISPQANSYCAAVINRIQEQGESIALGLYSLKNAVAWKILLYYKTIL